MPVALAGLRVSARISAREITISHAGHDVARHERLHGKFGTSAQLDYYLEQTLEYRLIGCTSDGGRRGEITVTYTNTAPTDEELPLYIDARSDLPLRPNGLPQSRQGQHFFFTQVYATPGASLVSVGPAIDAVGPSGCM